MRIIEFRLRRMIDMLRISETPDHGGKKATT